MNGGSGRKIAASLILLAGFLFIGAIDWVTTSAKSVGSGGDYIGYWAAGQRLAHHQDPYDPVAVLALERAHGFTHNDPSITPSPPAAWILLLPLGWVGAKPGVILWQMLSLACVAVALRLMFAMHGRPNTLLYLVGFLFAPVIACLIGNQLGIFFLLSVTLFLYLIDTRPFLAGAVLLPMALKPHLFFAFGVVLLLWAFQRRKLQPLFGFVTALAASTGVTLAYDPQIFPQYLHMWHTGSVKERVTPTLSVAFRFLINGNAHWLEFVPAFIAAAWAVWFYFSHRDRWQWLDHGLIVLLVSVMCAPYAWLTDESVLLVAVMTAAIRARHSWKALLIVALPAAIAFGEVLRAVDIKNHGYTWTTPAWLLAYLLSARMLHRTADSPAHAASTAGATQ